MDNLLATGQAENLSDTFSQTVHNGGSHEGSEKNAGFAMSPSERMFMDGMQMGQGTRRFG